MSQSWHCNSDEQESEKELRRVSRVVSLREKVTRLSRENKDLLNKMHEIEQDRSADVAKEATTALVKSSHDSGEKKEDSAAVDFLRKEVNGMHERLEEAAALLEKKDQDLAEVLRGRERDNQDFFQKLSSLQQQLAESNSQLRLLSTQTELYDKKLKDMEEERREMYLVMFKKGQEAASMGIREEREVDSMTEDRVVLRFLHDAFYYFMLNRGDSKEHLQAIMTMLNFTPEQKEDVTKRRGTRGASLH